MQISLDVEGVLADSHRAARKRSDRLTEDNCPPPQWDFPTEEHFKEFMHVSQNLWHNHNELIPTVSDGLEAATTLLCKHHTVDIVTSRTNVDEQILDWLDRHGVQFEDFYVTSGHAADKTAIGDHELHIEDSPQVARDALAAGRDVVLIDRPYNRSFDVRDSTTVVDDVPAAADLLCP